MKIGKDFVKNNPTIALNVFYIKEMEISPANFSKINSNCEKQIILLIIPNEEKEGWHYVAVKKTHFFTTKESPSLVIKYVKIKIFAQLHYHLKKIIY